jgi:hypothetical protein
MTTRTSSTSITSRISTAATVSSTPHNSIAPVTTTTMMSNLSISKGNLPAECSTYTLISDNTRHSNYPANIGCDTAIFKNLPTWVRFSGGAGSRLVNKAAEPFRCGTQGAGWYRGTYPSLAGTTIKGTVCFSWPGNTCQWSNSISITNCNDYYVFALSAPPACRLRYCTI